MENKQITISIPSQSLDAIIAMLENFKQAALAAKEAANPMQEPAGLEGLTDELVAADSTRRS